MTKRSTPTSSAKSRQSAKGAPSPKKTGRNKGGRPSSFKDEIIVQAEKLCALGATDIDIADFFDISVATLYRWKNDKPGFCEALKSGKAASDERVERSLYHKAVGYTFESEKIVTLAQGNNMGSVIERVPVREHVPPDTTAAIFWLKNRRPDLWRDKREHELSGKDGGPMEIKDASPLEAARRVAFALAAGAEALKDK